MNNLQIYKKTLGFSLRRVFWDLIGIILLLALGTLGFFVGDQAAGEGPIGLVLGLLIGLIALIIITRFVSYGLKAGQIAMMTRGITEGELPDDVIAEGKKVVKERFLTVVAFFAITRAIKGIFGQLGKAITNVTQNVGGDTGKSIGSVISSIMQTIINYLCDCCLGWVFYRQGVSSAKAACEGAAIFFKHGKTFFKNMGRIFGIGFLSLIVIGGAFTGIFYPIITAHPEIYLTIGEALQEALAEETSAFAELLKNPGTLPIVLAAIGGIIIWAMLHSVFIKPFVLTGVLRNFMESGMNDVPSEASLSFIDTKSDRFRKLHQQA